MSDGRTIWLPKDAAWWRREYVVELGEEFGAEGPAVLDWLCCEAKAQNADGTVKAGYRSLARGCFVDASTATAVVSRAVELGALDDFEGDDRRFVCRISGWAKDQERGAAAARKARQRDRAGPGVTERDMSRGVGGESAEDQMNGDVPLVNDGVQGAPSDPRSPASIDDPESLSRSVPPRPKMSPTGQDSKEEEEEEERGGEHGQPLAPPVAALHPHHGEVMAILEAAKAQRPGLVVDEASVNSALMAHRSGDAVSAAHETASQLADGTARTDIASTVLRWVLRGQGEQRGGGRRDERSSSRSLPGQSAALAAASRLEAQQREQRRPDRGTES